MQKALEKYSSNCLFLFVWCKKDNQSNLLIRLKKSIKKNKFLVLLKCDKSKFIAPYLVFNTLS